MLTAVFVKMFREESSSDYLRCRMSSSKHPAVSSEKCYVVQVNRTRVKVQMVGNICLSTACHCSAHMHLGGKILAEKNVQ